MIELTLVQREQIKQAALTSYPKEMCGVLLQDSFVALPNTAENPEEDFRIEAIALAPYIGKITAVVHSHTLRRKRPCVQDARTPSFKDVLAWRATQLPFLIVATDGEVVTEALEFPKPYSEQLLQRPFIWFVNDCYTIVQDYYKREFDINLPMHKAEVDFTEIKHQSDLFEAHAEAFGFVKYENVMPSRNGDLILVDGTQGKRNHLGIYHNGKIIHQSTMSVEVPLETFVGRVYCIYRHKDVG